jgi:LemA protein
MKTVWIVLGAIAAVVLIFFLWANGVYNKAISYDETTKEKWGLVQSAYQRRADLVPQLVATVKAGAANEGNILTEVTRARAGIVEYEQNLPKLQEDIKSAQTPQQLTRVDKTINSAINLAFEAYPTIRSTENYSKLQDQLEGTENRVKTERDAYSKAVKEYNTHIRGIMRGMALSMLGKADEFEKKESFEAVTEGAEQAPDVKDMFKEE